MKKRPRSKTANLIDDSRRIAAELLLTDCDLALTFIATANSSVQPDTRERNIANARKAYEDISQKRESIDMSPENAKTLQQKLDRLRDGLEALGENV